MVTNISREPAVFVALLASIIQFLGDLFLPWNTGQIGELNAVVAALAGLVTALWVTHDGLAAALAGFVQAVLALAVGLGLGLTSAQQGVLMTVVTMVIGFFIRTQVTAPVDHLGNRLP